ncbi:formylglycine-generating enzyme required for sulfatase activity [Mucilaginibacter oryzae]|uniref:Formylglycine-generating enzyme required for sulfatase activity n=1 Tax=Mucilaginibacter oryzae TaxID=468058 RepID=A0A316GX14_9SPHI|nr:formylglycine-generating enzyme family protein [Mucilaginibacter oryzae]PWK69257.1 formylglycine-generating enzyme required for sulfatase activity [Mucilaginibacter oryzae]
MKNRISILFGAILFAACGQQERPVTIAALAQVPGSKKKVCCESNLPGRFKAAGLSSAALSLPDTGSAHASHAGMVWVPAGTFRMGADNQQAEPDEYPKHDVTVDGFWMDKTEVTNAQFAKFIKATGYITTAERKPDWNELKKQMPPGTEKPADSLLVPASLVFVPADHPVNLDDYAQWWAWKTGANWKHPHGPGSDIKGKENYPVVQVSWYDAVAYSKWAGKRLPTEAEWERAARGGLEDKVYPWGNEKVNEGQPKANTWEGSFPYKNTQRDRYYYLAPVSSFKPNGYGLYDMAGNVWEWCADLYNNNYYKTLGTNGVKNPKGASKSNDPDEPYAIKRVVRGGSFLCNDAYCSGYRVSRRMKTTEDSGMEHLGFRCVSN